mmetsp:Transcript_13477/g.26679  ORF Transcript_13477/g.26679 Transcript_13477/m.26679 type:complete len:90 (-) Transcript_13477:383-652(-)
MYAYKNAFNFLFPSPPLLPSSTHKLEKRREENSSCFPSCTLHAQASERMQDELVKEAKKIEPPLLPSCRLCVRSHEQRECGRQAGARSN